jgi:protein phosphatase
MIIRMPRYLMIAGELILVAALTLLVFPRSPGLNQGLLMVGSLLIAIFGIGIVSLGFVLIRPRLLGTEVTIIEPEKAEAAPKGATFRTLNIGSTTDAGRRRTVNEDSMMVIEAQSAFDSRQRSRCLMIVGDGMGGHQKGELASSIGVKTVAEMVQPFLLDGEFDFGAGVERAIEEANSRILNYSLNHPECQGMGTTLTAAVIDGPQLVVGHVGDSRAYIIDDKTITQVTIDHSVVQEKVEKGEITAEQARTHPQRNIITRVVGYYGKVEPAIFRASLTEGDRVLVCCDGLVIHLTDDEIKQVVLQNPDPQEASGKLVALAIERGGQDNISVIVAVVRGISG